VAEAKSKRTRSSPLKSVKGMAAEASKTNLMAKLARQQMVADNARKAAAAAAEKEAQTKAAEKKAAKAKANLDAKAKAAVKAKAKADKDAKQAEKEAKAQAKAAEKAKAKADKDAKLAQKAAEKKAKAEKDSPDAGQKWTAHEWGMLMKHTKKFWNVKEHQQASGIDLAKLIVDEAHTAGDLLTRSNPKGFDNKLRKGRSLWKEAKEKQLKLLVERGVQRPSKPPSGGGASSQEEEDYDNALQLYQEALDEAMADAMSGIIPGGPNEWQHWINLYGDAPLAGALEGDAYEASKEKLASAKRKRATSRNSSTKKSKLDTEDVEAKLINAIEKLTREETKPVEPEPAAAVAVSQKVKRLVDAMVGVVRRSSAATSTWTTSWKPSSKECPLRSPRAWRAGFKINTFFLLWTSRHSANPKSPRLSPKSAR
jgi:hypothetical protein